MAVRIKCKCGKSLKISSKLADKALSCPGCGAKFRVPAAKFNTASSAGAAKSPATPAAAKPAAAKPPAQKPAVVAKAPAELDINPADLDIPGDISSSQSDILDGILPGPNVPTADVAVADLSGILDVLACPYCDEPLPFDAKLCVNCGYDLRTGQVLHAAVGGIAAASASSAVQDEDAAEDAPKAKPAKVGYAVDPLRQKRSGLSAGDVVQGPTRSFWADAFGSFAYPFAPPANAITFGIIIVLALVQVFLQTFVGGCLGLICIFIITGWFYSLYLSVVTETASGSRDMPGIKMEEGFMEDIFKPFFKFTGAMVLPFLPASLLLITTAISGSQSTAIGVNLLLLMLAGAFVWPVCVLMFAFDALAMLVRVDLIFATIYRTILAYLGLWLMLILVGSLTLLPLFAVLLDAAGWSVPLPELPEFGGMGGACFFRILDIYLMIVAMRMIGLYYLHFKKRFAIVME